MRRLVLAVVLAAAAACDGAIIPPETTGDLYDFRLVTNPPEVLRWPSGTRVRVYAAGGDGARADVLSGALVASMATWNLHALYGEYKLVAVTSPMDADVLLQWSDEPAVVDMSQCQSVISIAVTTFCRSETADDRLMVFPLLSPHQNVASTIRFVITIIGSQAASPETLHPLVLHELGHALGIGRHSPDPQDLMAEGTPTRTTLSQSDINTVQVLYHTQPHIVP